MGEEPARERILRALQTARRTGSELDADTIANRIGVSRSTVLSILNHLRGEAVVLRRREGGCWLWQLRN